MVQNSASALDDRFELEDTGDFHFGRTDALDRFPIAAGLPLRQVRVAVSMVGGSSLCMYENGVSQELFRMVHGQGLYGVLKRLTHSHAYIDVLSGTSAGGINTILLSTALTAQTDFRFTRDAWIKLGGIDELMQEPRAKNVKSLLRSEDYYTTELESAFERLTSVQSRDAVKWQRPGIPSGLDFQAPRSPLRLASTKAGAEVEGEQAGQAPGSATLNQTYKDPKSVTLKRAPYRDLDLFVTGTFHKGRPLTFYDARNRPIFTQSFAGVFELKHRPRRFESHFRSDCKEVSSRNLFPWFDIVPWQRGADLDARRDLVYKRLARIARTTSSLPAVFEASLVQPALMNRVIPLTPRSIAQQDLQSPQNNPALEGRVDLSVLERAPGDYMLDGGFLNNRPLDLVLKAIYSRAAAGEVSRKVLLVEPDPESLERRTGVETGPNALESLAFYVNVARYQSMSDFLQKIHDHNRRVSRFREIVSTTRSIDIPTDEEAEQPQDPEVRVWRELTYQDLRDAVLQIWETAEGLDSFGSVECVDGSSTSGGAPTQGSEMVSHAERQKRAEALGILRVGILKCLRLHFDSPGSHTLEQVDPQYLLRRIMTAQAEIYAVLFQDSESLREDPKTFQEFCQSLRRTAVTCPPGGKTGITSLIAAQGYLRELFHLTDLATIVYESMAALVAELVKTQVYIKARDTLGDSQIARRKALAENHDDPGDELTDLWHMLMGCFRLLLIGVELPGYARTSPGTEVPPPYLDYKWFNQLDPLSKRKVKRYDEEAWNLSGVINGMPDDSWDTVWKSIATVMAPNSAPQNESGGMASQNYNLSVRCSAICRALAQPGVSRQIIDWSKGQGISQTGETLIEQLSNRLGQMVSAAAKELEPRMQVMARRNWLASLKAKIGPVAIRLDALNAEQKKLEDMAAMFAVQSDAVETKWADLLSTEALATQATSTAAASAPFGVLKQEREERLQIEAEASEVNSRLASLNVKWQETETELAGLRALLEETEAKGDTAEARHGMVGLDVHLDALTDAQLVQSLRRTTKPEQKRDGVSSAVMGLPFVWGYALSGSAVTALETPGILARLRRLDRQTFPILRATELKNTEFVDLVHITPGNMQGNYSKRGADEKLAGDALFHFGGFLKASWRANDILWGRLDAVVGLTDTLLDAKRIKSLRLMASGNAADGDPDGQAMARKFLAALAAFVYAGEVLGKEAAAAEVDAAGVIISTPPGNPKDDIGTFISRMRVTDRPFHSFRLMLTALSQWLKSGVGSEEDIFDELKFWLVQRQQMEILQEEVPVVLGEAIAEQARWQATNTVRPLSLGAGNGMDLATADLTTLSTGRPDRPVTQALRDEARRAGRRLFVEADSLSLQNVSKSEKSPGQDGTVSILAPGTFSITALDMYVQHAYSVGSETTERDVPPLVMLRRTSGLMLTLIQLFKSCVGPVLETSSLTQEGVKSLLTPIGLILGAIHSFVLGIESGSRVAVVMHTLAWAVIAGCIATLMFGLVGTGHIAQIWAALLIALLLEGFTFLVGNKIKQLASGLLALGVFLMVLVAENCDEMLGTRVSWTYAWTVWSGMLWFLATATQVYALYFLVTSNWRWKRSMFIAGSLPVFTGFFILIDEVVALKADIVRGTPFSDWGILPVACHDYGQLHDWGLAMAVLGLHSAWLVCYLHRKALPMRTKESPGGLLSLGTSVIPEYTWPIINSWRFRAHEAAKLHLNLESMLVTAYGAVAIGILLSLCYIPLMFQALWTAVGLSAMQMVAYYLDIRENHYLRKALKVVRQIENPSLPRNARDSSFSWFDRTINPIWVQHREYTRLRNPPSGQRDIPRLWFKIYRWMRKDKKPLPDLSQVPGNLNSFVRWVTRGRSSGPNFWDDMRLTPPVLLPEAEAARYSWRDVDLRNRVDYFLYCAGIASVGRWIIFFSGLMFVFFALSAFAYDKVAGELSPYLYYARQSEKAAKDAPKTNPQTPRAEQAVPGSTRHSASR